MTTTNLPPELMAMAQIEAAMKNLSEEEIGRVMLWAVARFGSPKTSSRKFDLDAPDDDRASSESSSGQEYGNLAEFYDAAAPSTEADRALVVAHWIQFEEGATDVDAHRVNSELKHLGHGVSNITRAFENLKAQKPALVIQTRKEGKTRQARKKYKVTTEGKKAIERMLAGTSDR